MRKVLLLSTLALCATPVAAVDTAHCDATPFTLGKPAPATPKAAEPAGNQQAKVQPAKKKPHPKAVAQAKPTLFAPCKEGKTKKPG